MSDDMKTARKFLFSYDAKYDADIAQVIEETPQRRTSARLRHLIRLGLSIEQQTASVKEVSSILNTRESTTIRHETSNDDIVPTPPTTSSEPRRRHLPRFSPPS